MCVDDTSSSLSASSYNSIKQEGAIQHCGHLQDPQIEEIKLVLQYAGKS